METMRPTEEIGTNTKKFTLVAEIEIWKSNDDEAKWDLWIDNTQYPNLEKSDVISKIVLELERKKHRE